MLKKRTYVEATAEPPVPQAAIDTPVKKQKSVHFGAVQIVGQTDKRALEAAFNHAMAQPIYQKGCLKFNRMIVTAHCTLPLWEECRKQLESLRLDTEAAIQHKLQMEMEYTMTI